MNVSDCRTFGVLASSSTASHPQRVSDTINTLDPAAVRRQSGRRASAPTTVQYIQQRCAEAFAERLEWLNVQPRTILDVSADGGLAAGAAAARFRGAEVLRAGAAAAGGARRRWWQRGRERIVADAGEPLAVAADSVDLALASLNLPWLSAPDALFEEIRRALATDAPLLLAAPGPDTFRELRDAWASLGLAHQVPVFPDMHDIGDALVRAGFVEPVLDVDRFTVEFRTPAAIWRDLKAAGAGNVLANRRRGLVGRSHFAAVSERLLTQGAPLAVSVELVFAHAFAAPKRPTSASGEVQIDPFSIGRRPR